MSNKQKLIEIPANLRLTVPADMSEADIEKMVKVLTMGDFAVYPDDAKGSLVAEVVDHLNVGDDKELGLLTKQISDVDLWASDDTYQVTEL